MTFFVRALGLIPLPLLYIWGWLAFGITFYLLRWRREQVERDVALSLPHLSANERARVVRDSYLHAADTLIEMLWGFGASGRAIMRRVAFENPELIQKLEAEKKTVVLLTPHARGRCNRSVRSTDRSTFSSIMRALRRIGQLAKCR